MRKRGGEYASDHIREIASNKGYLKRENNKPGP